MPYLPMNIAPDIVPVALYICRGTVYQVHFLAGSRL